MKKPKHISKNPGVYIFKDLKQKPLYVGKAGNLKKRLAFYFSRSPKSSKLAKLLIEAKKLEIIETESEIEALIKEAELIKKHLPKYNVLMRDDKNYFYVGITKEKFPRIFITHQPDTHPKFQIINYKLQIKSPPSLKLRRASKIQNPKHVSDFGFRASNFINYIGPFTDGGALKTTLRLLRRIFPYCTCKELHKRPCLNAEIGRCPGFCCLKTTTNYQQPTTHNAKFYKNNIKNIINVLSGKKKRLLAELKRKMKEVSKKQEFEKAAVLRDQIWGLENIFEHHFTLNQPVQYTDISYWTKTEFLLKQLLKTKKTIKRIEGYDISNISGKEATGSMVVFVKKTNGTYAPDKNEYRKFKIKTVHQISDVDMLAEVIKRRFNHPEWQYPDLIVVDGGKPQLSAALSALPTTYNRQPTTIITALAKGGEELYIKNRKYPIKLKKRAKEVLHLFQRVRDESHRFAKKYHHVLRKFAYREE